MNEPDREDPGSAAIVAELQRRPNRTAFVSELVVSLVGDLAKGQALAPAFSDLEDARQVLVRQFYCGDPHLNGMDFRIAGLVEENGETDPVTDAVARIDGVWSAWVSEFLANHRCT